MGDELKLGDRVHVRGDRMYDFDGTIIEADTPLVLVQSDPRPTALNPKISLSTSRWVHERYCSKERP